LYALLERLARRTGGWRVLARCGGRDEWPLRGVYFFQEDGERRAQSGDGARIVRVGTHALKVGSQTTIWKRISQHKGVQKSGGGSHRGSIFRLLIGTALIARDLHQCDSWGVGGSAPKDIRARELPMERRVSETIGRMRVICLPILDEAGPDSLRGVIERNSIALLSNFSNHNRPPIDAPSCDWLGAHCARERVRRSGIWNQRHVEDDYDRSFLAAFEQLVNQSGG
ncbi:MAG: hypothetical protein ACR2P7_03685, partial [bacterium]